MVAKGIVRGGRIEITEGLLPPEGAAVELEVKQVAPPPDDPALIYFGLWRDRGDMGDSRDVVRAVRESQWKRS